MSDPLDPERDDALQAAEYVLHLMPADERAAFEARLEVEGGLRAEVAHWAESFADLAAGIAPQTPPVRIRKALEERIRPAPERSRPAPSILRRLLGFAGGAALAASLALAAFVVVNRDILFGLSPATLIAEMQSDDSPFVLRAGYHPDEAVLVVARSAGEVTSGRVLELWLIAPGASAPVSLGVLPDAPRVDLVVPEPLRAILPGSTLAISDEPPGGSPTGAPTGSVLALGALQQV
jgi:anti-sigma-K factor RskA